MEVGSSMLILETVINRTWFKWECLTQVYTKLQLRCNFAPILMKSYLSFKHSVHVARLMSLYSP